jgi:2-hydroxychromene-2-carboxylate isomerase
MAVSATFYFDLASPEAYLAAERALVVLPGPCAWQPILARMLPAADQHDAYRCETELLAAREGIERRAQALGLQRVVWPEPFPFESDFAMLTATFARRIGKCVPFALAAFRQAFAAGHALSDTDNVLIAGAACEMHPRAILATAQTSGVRAELEQASTEALAAGVSDVPAVVVDGQVFVGEPRLEAAGALLAVAIR